MRLIIVALHDYKNIFVNKDFSTYIFLNFKLLVDIAIMIFINASLPRVSHHFALVKKLFGYSTGI